MKAATEEHHAIKIIKDMDNAIVHNPFPKHVHSMLSAMKSYYPIYVRFTNTALACRNYNSH